MTRQAELPIITTSERTAFRRCPQLWQWGYEQGLISRYEIPDALWFGQGVHIALAKWYRKGKRRGTHPAKTFKMWVDGEFREVRYSGEAWDDEAKYADAADLGVAMLEHYVDHYGRDQHWEIIAVEQPFRIKITRKGVPVAIFMSTWDAVYRDLRNGLIYLLEHKTASQVYTAYLEMDDQAGSYWAVAEQILRAKGILGPREHIAGIQYNFLRKAMPDIRPQDETGYYLNKDGSVSKKQPAPYFVRPDPIERSPRETTAQLNRIADEVAVMNAVRAGTIPVTKSTTKDCPHCVFWDMCTLHERGGTAWLQVQQADFVESDPHERYTKSAGGSW